MTDADIPDMDNVIRRHPGDGMEPHVDIQNYMNPIYYNEIDKNSDVEKVSFKMARYGMIIYLNDDYEGGELSFSVKDGVLTSTDNAASEDFESDKNIGKLTFSVKPEAGSVIIFPSESPYSHTAHLVKSGLKYMVPSFWLNKGSFVDGVFVPE